MRGTIQLLNTSDKQSKKAEEIKLNVAALGNDLLNNSQAGTNNNMIVSKVNNLVGSSVPSVAESAAANEEGDGGASGRCEESKQGKIDDVIAESSADRERISIRHLENTLSYEDEVTLDAHRDDDDYFDEDIKRQLK